MTEFSPFFKLAGLERPRMLWCRLLILKAFFKNPNYHFTIEEMARGTETTKTTVKDIFGHLIQDEYIHIDTDEYGESGYILNKQNKVIKGIHKFEYDLEKEESD